MAISRKDFFKDIFSSESADRVFATVEDAEDYIKNCKKQTHFHSSWDTITYRLAQVKCGIPLVEHQTMLNNLQTQIKELQEDIRIKDEVLSELQVPAKWYDNIPEQGVLCWVRRELGGVKKIATIYKYHEHDGFQTAFFWVGISASVIPLTNEEIEEFKR